MRDASEWSQTDSDIIAHCIQVRLFELKGRCYWSVLCKVASLPIRHHQPARVLIIDCEPLTVCRIQEIESLQ